jgi:hypothetical protein
MLHSSFWRPLALAVSCVLFVAMSLPLTMLSRTAFAQVATTAAVTVERVWTRDGNGNDKINFVDGDPIQYTVIVTNSGSTTVTATFVFEATGPRQIFSWKEDAPVPQGTHGFYSPSAVPNDAPPGTYTIQVTVTYNGQSSTKKSPFTVMLTQTNKIWAGYATAALADHTVTYSKLPLPRLTSQIV